jgi:hypothetical protein
LLTQQCQKLKRNRPAQLQWDKAEFGYAHSSANETNILDDYLALNGSKQLLGFIREVSHLSRAPASGRAQGIGWRVKAWSLSEVGRLNSGRLAPGTRMVRSSLRGWLGLPSDFLAQGTRHRCRKPCVHLHQFETRPRPWSAVRGVIRRVLLGGLWPSGRSHVTSPGSARPSCG